MPNYTEEEKKKILQKITSGELTQKAASDIYRVNRVTLYNWKKQHEERGNLIPGWKRGGHHYKQHPSYVAGKILEVVSQYPRWSALDVYEYIHSRLGLKVGYYTVQTILEKNHLTTQIDRHKYSQIHKNSTRGLLENTKKIFSDSLKQEIINELMSGKITSRQLQQLYGVSRVTLYNWKKQFKNTGTITTRYRQGNQHYKSIPQSTVLEILSLVAVHPEYSIRQFLMAAKENNIVVSWYAIQKILERYNLNKQSDRYIYSQKFAPQPQTEDLTRTSIDTVSQPAFDELSPNVLPGPPPPGRALWAAHPPGKPPFMLHTRQVFGASFLLSFSIVYFSFQAWDAVFSAESFVSAIGMLFALIALLAGTIFFLYSIKYYLSIAWVLFISRKASQKDPESLQEMQGRTGMLSDTSTVVLDRQPFVSIHIPLYNEKRVVNRLLEAVTSMEYDNYEVVVCDDSTDETKDIVEEWRNHPRVKISHRDNRVGFKGAALEAGRKLMHPQTEFVIVFDADFLPYPDTIQQFLKYFKAATGTLENPMLKQFQNETGRSLDPPKADDSGGLGNESLTGGYASSNIAAIQGYQWHVLNKSENWITRGVRTEYAGSYVIERSGGEVYGGLKQIAGSVFMIRADVLNHYGWKTSITEDFQLTLRLYKDGFKVLYTPYIQAPSECVSTLKRLVRQRMRWAEGHSHNIKLLFKDVLLSHNTSPAEKFEFGYLAPYYLQSAFFLLGTFAWFVSETVFKVKLPFWTAVWGWSLVLTNLLSLPLMNTVGLFLEETEEKDYIGIFSFVLLSYILAPFQAYASVKGFLEREEGPWFRTPKTGKITDIYKRGRFYDWIKGLFGSPSLPLSVKYLNYVVNLPREEIKTDSRFMHRKRGKRFVVFVLLFVFALNYLAFFTPTAIKPARAANPTIQQQMEIMNIINFSGTADSTTYEPTDNSLGIIYWDADNYNGATVYFEAQIRCLTTDCTGGTNPHAAAALTDTSGNEVSGSKVSNGTASSTLVRSSAITLTDNTEYTVRIKIEADSGTPSGTAAIREARLVIVQTSASSITNTQTSITIGKQQGLTSSTYTQSTNKKIYNYNSSVFSPTPTIYFEATIVNNTAATVSRAALFTDGTSCSSQVTNSEVTVTGTTYTRVRSPAITLSDSTDYMVCLKADGHTATLANAQIIIVQSSASGITAVETMEHFHHADQGFSTTSYVASTLKSTHNPSNWAAGTFTYYFEVTMRAATGTILAQLRNSTDGDAIDTPTNSEVSTASTSNTRQRSSSLGGNSDWPSSAKDFVLQGKGGAIGDSGTITSGWVIVQVSSLQTPEHIWFLFPFALFIPYVIKLYKDRRGKSRIKSKYLFCHPRLALPSGAWRSWDRGSRLSWIPAFAGMTHKNNLNQKFSFRNSVNLFRHTLGRSQSSFYEYS